MGRLRKLAAKVGDWCAQNANPMLVKEIRQGLRTKIFLGAFLAVQGVMQFSMLIAVASTVDYDSEGMGMATGFFWFTVTVPLLILMPLRGAGAISGEQKANLLELVFLTRLTAWRTLWGKWLALFVQCLLLVVAVLPYTIMRYYLGGIDMLQELLALLILLLVSGILIALEVAQSAMKGGLIRGGALLLVLWIASPFVMSAIDFSGMTWAVSTTWTLIYAFVAGALLVVLMLEVGASYVAPQAENHSIRKRLLGLALLTVSLLFAAFVDGALVAGIVIGGAVYFLVLADGLCEPLETDVLLAEHQPERGLFRRLIDSVFGRGWISALVLTLISTAVFVGLALMGPAADFLITCGGLFLGCLLLPPAVNRLFSYRLVLELPMFLLILGIALLLGLITFMVEELLGIGLVDAASFIAPSLMAATFMEDRELVNVAFLENVWIGNAILLVILVIRAIQALVVAKRPADVPEDHLTGDNGLLT